MVESRFLVGDTVRIQGDTRIWEVSDIGYSERMKEHTYIVETEGNRRKVLEHQMETAPVVFTIKEISAALKRVEFCFCTDIEEEMADADDRDIQIFKSLVRGVIKGIRKELTGNEKETEKQ